MKTFVKSGVLTLLVFINLVCVGESKTWALITAGSSTWDNYRHQADACHAYQILHRNGVPDENIVVMMYDDIAHNKQNPNPGVIINKPNGPNVYEGVLKDYTGPDVTAANFLNVLRGNSEAMNGIGSGKVINSGPDDDVFVFFTDHGAPGILAFPVDELPLKKGQLLDALNFMHQKNKYKKMVLYVEACESGSMFSDELPDNTKIFATTAANPMEPSSACYYDGKLNTFLGDVYSVAWMENSDKANLTQETLQQQFKKVKRKTNTSHVQEYGDMSVSSDPVIDYQGEGKGRWVSAKDTTEYPVTDAVPSPEVPMAILQHRLSSATLRGKETLEIKFKIRELTMLHRKIKLTVHKIAEKATSTVKEKDWAIQTKFGEVHNLKCHEKVVDAFTEKCYRVGKIEAALRYIYVVTNLCELKTIPLSRILEAIETSCQVASNQTLD